MTEVYHACVYLMVELNYLGMFTTNPRAYTGGQKYLVNGMDFHALEYDEFMEFLLRFIGEDFARSSIAFVIALCAGGEKELVDQGKRAHPAPRQTTTGVGGEGVVDEIAEYHIFVKLNKTVGDEFLKKLCPDDNKHEEEENDDILVQPSFNPVLPRKLE
ncbi:hypothetical protein LXL04_023526 [Taraxacum kok-saghyz]